MTKLTLPSLVNDCIPGTAQYAGWQYFPLFSITQIKTSPQNNFNQTQNPKRYFTVRIKTEVANLTFY